MPSFRRADALRLIALRLNVPPIESVARTPGTSEAYRVTVQYLDGQHPDQIATLTLGQSSADSAKLSVHYRRADGRPLVLTPLILPERARMFATELRIFGFDQLDDMPDLPWRGAEMWLIERAAGAFVRDLVLSPGMAQGVYGQIAALVREKLSEAVRPIRG
ncbi:MAG: hypothetical protein ACYDBJ_10340 [Aggregatilineales bacterium]